MAQRYGFARGASASAGALFLLCWICVTTPHTCDKCQCPLTEIDFYGKRLKDAWIDSDNAWHVGGQP
jgi:hypothetical protein